MAKKLDKPSLIVNHDYLSIVFGNGRRLTKGRSGEKATGAVPIAVFNEFSKRMMAKEGGNFDVRMKKFIDEINTIWPEWNVPPKAYKVGQTVKMDLGKRQGGMDEGEVTKVRGTSVTVRWKRNGLINVTADMLDEFNS